MDGLVYRNDAQPRLTTGAERGGLLLLALARVAANMLRVQQMRIARMIVAMTAGALAGQAQIGNIVVTSAASFQTGMPWPGSIASLFCTGLTGISGIVVADGYPLPVELVGVRVRIGGVPAPLFAVAQINGYQQINLQVPPGGTGSVDVGVTVEQGDRQTTVRVPVAASLGELFRLPGGSGAFQHAVDYALVSDASPARAGEVVIGYLSGLVARTSPVVLTGQPAPSNPPAVVDQVLASGVSRPRFEISVGEPPNRKLVAPLFLGLAPGLVGVFQANFTVPEGLAGNQPVRLVENRCLTPMFSNACLDVYAFYMSIPVPMAVQ